MVRGTRVGRTPRGRNPSIRVQIPASPLLFPHSRALLPRAKPSRSTLRCVQAVGRPLARRDGERLHHRKIRARRCRSRHGSAFERPEAGLPNHGPRRGGSRTEETFAARRDCLERCRRTLASEPARRISDHLAGGPERLRGDPHAGRFLSREPSPAVPGWRCDRTRAGSATSNLGGSPVRKSLSGLSGLEDLRGLRRDRRGPECRLRILPRNRPMHPLRRWRVRHGIRMRARIPVPCATRDHDGLVLVTTESLSRSRLVEQGERRSWRRRNAPSATCP